MPSSLAITLASIQLIKVPGCAVRNVYSNWFKLLEASIEDSVPGLTRNLLLARTCKGNKWLRLDLSIRINGDLNSVFALVESLRHRARKEEKVERKAAIFAFLTELFYNSQLPSIWKFVLERRG
jgi:hypothetical protein